MNDRNIDNQETVFNNMQQAVLEVLGDKHMSLADLTAAVAEYLMYQPKKCGKSRALYSNVTQTVSALEAKGVLASKRERHPSSEWRHDVVRKGYLVKHHGCGGSIKYPERDLLTTPAQCERCGAVLDASETLVEIYSTELVPVPGGRGADIKIIWRVDN